MYCSSTLHDIGRHGTDVPGSESKYLPTMIPLIGIKPMRIPTSSKLKTITVRTHVRCSTNLAPAVGLSFPPHPYTEGR